MNFKSGFYSNKTKDCLSYQRDSTVSAICCNGFTETPSKVALNTAKSATIICQRVTLILRVNISGGAKRLYKEIEMLERNTRILQGIW